MGILSSQEFMPHGHCYLGNQALIGFMSISDSLIGISYFVITVCLYKLLKKIEMPFSLMIVSFAVFIGACGVSHFLDVYTLWVPIYWVSVVFKVATACASIASVGFLIRYIPSIVKLRKTLLMSGQRAKEVESLAELLVQANEELRQSEQRYRHLIDGIKDHAVFGLDVNGIISSWGGGAKGITQYSASEIIGAHFSRFRVPEDSSRITSEHILKTASLEGSFEMTCWHLRKDGSRFWADVVITAVRSLDGHVTGFSKIVRDVTEKKKAEEEKNRIEIEKRAEAASLKHKSQFLTAITHEIRTPINGILGVSDLLAQTPLNHQQSEFVRILSMSGKNLLTLLNSILNFSNLQVGAVDLESAEFSLSTLVDEISGIILQKAHSKGLRFTREITAGTPDRVKGDYGRLQQVLMNLIDNAVKFTEHGSILLRVSGAVTIDGRPQILFEVTDTGVGIAEDSNACLFVPFSRHNPSSIGLNGGAGLGLSTSKKLVDLMSGQIKFQTEVGKGSTFSFHVPLEICEVQREEKKAISFETKQKINILLAEDNPVNQKIFILILQALGYAVESVENGLEAFHLVQSKKYDLVLMDCLMPEMDGYEATALIRKLERGGGIPIVALTANSLPGDREKCLSAGMTDYLSKPVTRKALDQMICKWVFKSE